MGIAPMRLAVRGNKGSEKQEAHMMVVVWFGVCYRARNGLNNR